MNRRRGFAVLVAGAVVALAAGVAAYRLGTPVPSTDPDPAAELFYRQTLRDADGAARPMAENRGKVVVVNFWATWCVPCVQEIPAFSKASREVAGRVAFVGLGIDSPSHIAAFVERVKPAYPLVAAGAAGTDLARAFGNPSGALPFTVLLGADGRVIASHLGRVDDALLARWLAPYRERAATAGAVAELPRFVGMNDADAGQIAASGTVLRSPTRERCDVCGGRREAGRAPRLLSMEPSWICAS